jgi:hypothetical protein
MWHMLYIVCGAMCYVWHHRIGTRAGWRRKRVAGGSSQVLEGSGSASRAACYCAVTVTVCDGFVTARDGRRQDMPRDRRGW